MKADQKQLKNGPFRVLIVILSSLDPNLGGAQIGLNLGHALEELGCQVTYWTPTRLSSPPRWWNLIQYIKTDLAAFLKNVDPFDVIDVPPPIADRRLKRHCRLLVARSIQPDIQYAFCHNWRAMFLDGQLAQSLRTLLYAIYLSWFTIIGYNAADIILCLGTAQLRMLAGWAPWLRKKLDHYVVAPSREEQRAFAEIRSSRTESHRDAPRFLWLGRWVYHKGTRDLLTFVESAINTYPACCFTVAGCGKTGKDALEKAFPYRAQLHVIESFDRSELPDILKRHNVGVFTSLVEGWGLVLNEMIESGMPVVAAVSGGVSDLAAVVGSQIIKFPALPQQDIQVAQSVDWGKYYKAFSWPEIAKGYVKTLRRAEAKLKSHWRGPCG